MLSFWGDMPMVLRWWLTLIVMGWIGWPICRRLFGEWENGGYIMAKAIGILGISLGVWLLGILRIMPFTYGAIIVAGGVTAGVGWAWNRKWAKQKIKWQWLMVEELFFGAALVAWVWVKAHEPTINGLEKFMDYGFTQSILRSDFFPPADMWFAGKSINYYYFGHLMMATITKAAGVGLEWGFNLMLATLFALCFTMSFGIARRLLAGVKIGPKIAGAVLTAFLVSLSGNLHTIYTLTRGYMGQEDNPPPFWEIMINPLDKKQRELARRNYWYPNATRFIPYTIHEFPGYSFVVSDVHGHVLSIPLALLLIAMLVNIFGQERKEVRVSEYAIYGVVAAGAFMTNALDGLIYLGLFSILTIAWQLREQRSIKGITARSLGVVGKNIGVAGAAFAITAAAFVIHFKPFVSGVAVNCPPAVLAGKTFGPVVFEGVEKCQKSPVWMMVLLWGLFAYGGIWLWQAKEERRGKKIMLAIWAVYCLGLVIFPEFFYFKDIYPQHFRSNTMFKLGYQVFILMALMTGYVITKMLLVKGRAAKVIFGLGLMPLLYLVTIYPAYSVRSYFGDLNWDNYKRIYGLEWLENNHPGDFAAVTWLNQNVSGQPVILEANGDSYTDYERISTFTGLPTIAGWTVHEWLWRGGYGPIAGRAEEVRQIYEAAWPEYARPVLQKYGVEYIILGDLERQKYPNIHEEVMASLGRQVFRQESTAIYKVN